ncbi:transpeptidase family protein [Geomonas paludis]|uniref:Penicillin-binding protein n=1 Tax=Geomonas paludis TaxID=2740185 RepID=A0A6V8MS60_9BACT|nr:penicillin-binding protein [Geomonas paludis]UPU35563.1 transpeptidase family protein [Geomonas paludis]GFO62861.1 penicillin-binding protein [Geomonas paludis]
MIDKWEKWARVRMRFVALLFVGFFIAASGRAFYLQVLDNDKLVKIAEKQHQKSIPLTPSRGGIYDRNNAPFAVSIEMDSCYAETRNMENVSEAAAQLAPALGCSKEELEAKLKAARNFVWLARRMPPEQAKRVKALDLEGVGFVKESRRFYPNSQVAAHVIGFTGLDPSGLEGVEKKYDNIILGNTGYLVTERDALGRDIALKKGSEGKAGSKGSNVVLTLDKNIQYIAEKELTKTIEKNGAKAGIAIVMEPDTGRVLAMANYPSFNPNNVKELTPGSIRNRAIADSFEPGSTFKIFLVAAALEAGVIRPGDSFNCENGSCNMYGRTIHDTHKYGALTVPQVLKYSSNIGAAKIGQRLGPQRLFTALTGFGFGERSSIDLPGEVAGMLRPQEKWYGIDLATISFGQGVTATALQLTAAVSAVANGGNLMKPYLVDRIVDDEGVVLQQFGPQLKRRVISPETAKTVAHMLEGVVGEGGTGTGAAVDGYRVAGKTGTAQKVEGRSYSASKRIGSFVGFVPVEKPRLAIMVMVDEPTANVYGGVVAAPAFSAIAQQTLCYLNVPPDKSIKKKQAPAPEKVTPQAEQAVVEGGTVEGADAGAMPNFRGMSMRQVLRVMEQRGLNVKLQGSGRAVEQNPPPGARITTQDQVWVRFVPSA